MQLTEIWQNSGILYFHISKNQKRALSEFSPAARVFLAKKNKTKKNSLKIRKWVRENATTKKEKGEGKENRNCYTVIAEVAPN